MISIPAVWSHHVSMRLGRPMYNEYVENSYIRVVEWVIFPVSKIFAHWFFNWKENSFCRKVKFNDIGKCLFNISE